MALINVWVFLVLRICKISFSCINLCLQINSAVRKIPISAQTEIAVTLNVLSEITDAFAYICLVLEGKNVDFIKTRSW